VPRTVLFATACSAALALTLLTGCSAPGADVETTDEVSEETSSSETESDVVDSTAVSFAAITSAATCIFSPDELTSAYAPWSAYVSGPAIPGSGSSEATCEYSHADEAQQYVSVPFTIWVEGYSYLDPDLALRAGLGSVSAPNGLDRAAIEAHYCLPGGALPPEVTAYEVITCESTPSATIMVFDNYRAMVARDDMIWGIDASGSTSPFNAAERDSLLLVARLAAERTV
jgi:hypothetical protein